MSALIRQTLFIDGGVRPDGPAARSAAAEDPLTGILGTGNDLLVEFVYEFMVEQFGTQLGVGMDVTMEDVKAFVEESTLRDDLAALSASMVNDLLTGENTTVLDSETVVALFEKNADLIRKHFDVEITEEITGVIADAVNNNEHIARIREEGLANTILAALTGGNDAGSDLMQRVTEVMARLQIFLRGPILGTCLGVCLLCGMLILLLNRKWLARGLYNIGMPLLLAALPSAALFGCILLMAEAWTALMTGPLAVVGVAGKAVAEMASPLPLGIFAGGLILCLIGTKILLEHLGILVL
jgi:hypothetical protein